MTANKNNCGTLNEMLTCLPATLPEDAATYFPGELGQAALRAVCLALAEDGRDLTSQAIFGPADQADQAEGLLICKQDSVIAGLPLISVVLAALGKEQPKRLWQMRQDEGDQVQPGQVVAYIQTDARTLLKAERIILNFITHLSGIATLTRAYVRELEGTGVKLLDTRKTLPGLRLLEKYAVRVAGGYNHRLNLEEMLMIKDNHTDAAGSIIAAVAKIREAYQPCPPLEIECRNRDEVLEAVMVQPERIMLDNMSPVQLAENLPLIPRHIEAEISGNVTLENIRAYAKACPSRPADYISVGRITHSAPSADYSLKIKKYE